MRLHHSIHSVFAFAALAAAACSDADSPQPVAPCSGNVTISVTTATARPRFDWQPRCAVSLVTVTNGPSVNRPLDNWALAADSAVIIPPVDYAETRAGVRSTTPFGLECTFVYRIELYVGRAFVSYGGWLQP